MKRISYLLLSVFLMLAIPSIAQEKTKKSLRSENKIQAQLSLEEKLNSKEFEFLALRAISSGHVMVDLAGDNYSMLFAEDIIKSYLPYYGFQYRGSTFGKDQGMKFRGKPTSFIVSKIDKSYQVDAEVQTDTDVFSISMFVSESGSATLSITSKNKSIITYEGEIR